MKKLSLLLSMAVVAMSVLFTSCSDDEDAADPIGPSLSITSTDSTDINGATVVVNPGGTVMFTITAREGASNMQTLSFRANGLSIPVERFAIDGEEPEGADINLRGGDRNSFRSVIVLDASTIAPPVMETIAISVVDNDGQTAGVEFILSTEAEATNTPLESTLMGQIFHVEGMGAGSYDLLANTAVSSTMENESVSDLRNTDEPLTFTGSFTGSFSGTSFVTTTGIDFENATLEDIMMAYSNGMPGPDVNNPSVNDVFGFITRRNGNQRPGLLRITAIEEAAGTNNGSLSFDYRLAPVQ